MNWPFLTLIGRPVPAAASSRSVCRARKAGIWSRSTTSAIGSAWWVSWTSVVTGRPVSALTRSKTFRPSVDARPAEARHRSPVGLVERRLEDERDAQRPQISDQPRGDLTSVRSFGSITQGRRSGPAAGPCRSDTTNGYGNGVCSAMPASFSAGRLDLTGNPRPGERNGCGGTSLCGASASIAPGITSIVQPGFRLDCSVVSAKPSARLAEGVGKPAGSPSSWTGTALSDASTTRRIRRCVTPG